MRWNIYYCIAKSIENPMMAQSDTGDSDDTARP